MSEVEIKALAELYDRFAHALDPYSLDRDRAEDEFYRYLEQLHCRYAPTAPMPEFRREAVRQCKLYLKKN